METKQTNHTKSKKTHPTLISTLFFILLDLILLVIASWVLLEIGWSVQLIVKLTSSNHEIQSIVNTDFMLIKEYRPQYSEAIATALQALNHFTIVVGNFISRESVNVFIGITEITLTRLFLFIAFIPCTVVMLCMAIIDGLVLRDKRKFQGARESTLLFHRLKSLALLSFLSLFFIYMVAPCAFSPILLLVLMSLCSSLLMTLSIKHFKKYL